MSFIHRFFVQKTTKARVPMVSPMNFSKILGRLKTFSAGINEPFFQFRTNTFSYGHNHLHPKRQEIGKKSQKLETHHFIEFTL